MEQVQRGNIPARMRERIAGSEGQGYALLHLTHDGTNGGDVWTAALENAKGKARIITCLVDKTGAVVTYVFGSKQGFQALAERFTSGVNAWIQWEPPDKNKSRQACGAPDGRKV